MDAERTRHLQEISDHQVVTMRLENEIVSLEADVERRHQAQLDTEDNSRHLVSENRKLVQKMEALSQAEKKKRLDCEDKCKPDCLCEPTFKMCEQAYTQLQTLKDELADIKEENASLHEKNQALEFENESQKIKHTEMDKRMAIVLNSQKHSEDRIQTLLAQVELLEVQNKEMQGSAWQTVATQRKKTTLQQQAVLSAPPTSAMGPPATTPALRLGSTLPSTQASSSATQRPGAASSSATPTYAAAVAAPVASPRQQRQVRQNSPPLDETVGHFSTFYITDFTHAISDQSKTEAKEYVCLLYTLTLPTKRIV